jgi:hypothetical protein
VARTKAEGQEGKRAGQRGRGLANLKSAAEITRLLFRRERDFGLVTAQGGSDEAQPTA